MHVFLDAGGGNVLAFFELPTRPPMDRDRNTPTWTQHLAFELASLDELLAVNTATPAMRQRLDAVKWAMLDEWAKTRKASKHAAWMHDGSYRCGRAAGATED